jgi:hypothetical protein
MPGPLYFMKLIFQLAAYILHAAFCDVKPGGVAGEPLPEPLLGGGFAEYSA